MGILQDIHCQQDLLNLTEPQKACLCREIREFLIENVAKTGGHLAGNLGVVELSVAIETVYNTRKDRLVFDVGHQSYVHKLLTGRQADFPSLRQYGGLSGFPKPSESVTDAFVAGHASSSVSIALGMARARTLLNQDYNVVAVVGDGAATGGMIYEALNDLAVSKEPMVVILNDNEMSISKSIGGLSRHLSRVRSSQNYLHAKRYYRTVLKKIPGGNAVYKATSHVKNRLKRMLMPGTMFENMGITYLGPADGHDLPGITALINSAKEMREPVLVHVITKKGCGYPPAQEDPTRFHGIGKFDPVTGKSLGANVPTYSGSFGQTMVDLASRDSRICAITAAMSSGTGLTEFMRRFPERTFDVGIAEEHAVSMAGGLAKQGMIPVVALYSTFLQRSYDQLMQDVAMLHLHVVLAIDRAGLVGDDGPTHHGVFDVGFLGQMPGMLILSPASLAEQRDMLRWAIEVYDGPVAVRYPRGGQGAYTGSAWQETMDIHQGNLCCHRSGSDVTLVTYGSLINNVLESAQMLERQGIQAAVLRLMDLSGFPAEQILKAGAGPVVVIEETCTGSGIRERLAWALRALDPERMVCGIDLGPDFVPHGSQEKLYGLCGLDAASITEFVRGVTRHED